MTYDVVVIGAGPNGLAAAAVLAKAGQSVLVLEAADEIGGHTRAIEFAPGFRSPLHEDSGWMPPAVARDLDAVGVAWVSRGIDFSVARDDGSLWTARPRSKARFADAVRELSPKDAARWPRFVAQMRSFAGVLERLYQLPAPDIATSSLAEVLPLLGVGRKVRALGRSDMTELLRVLPMPIADLLDDTFESATLKAGLASAAVRDIRQGPRSGGTTFNFLHFLTGGLEHLARSRPWSADAPDAMARRVADVARARGAVVRTGARVERITVREHRVTGVVLAGGEEVAARVVLSTADPRRTLLGMVPPEWLDPEFMLAVHNIRMRGCTAYAFYALDYLPEGHDAFGSAVCLTQDMVALERAADAAKYGEVSTAPHVEFFAPTVRWPSLAPEGKHVIAARVQYAPHTPADGPWTRDHAAQLERAVTAAVGSVVPDLDSVVTHRALLSPRDVEERFGVTEGALAQGEHALDQILFMRPVAGWSRHATPIDGLYLGGAGTHPGHAVLGGAGWLAAREVLKLKGDRRQR